MLAYMAGLFHDSERLSTEKVDHSESSAERAVEIFKKFGLKGEDLERLYLAIKDHRTPVKWKDPLHQSIFLADKVFEQMGSYAVFRRCLYAGECEDFKDIPMEEAVTAYFRKRLGLLEIKNFPERFHRLVHYRNKPPVHFFTSLEQGEEWAFSLARFAYQSGRSGTKIEDTIENFTPGDSSGQEFREQALSYLGLDDYSGFSKYL